MRIAISGAANQGKTTFLRDFIQVYDMYDTPVETYRDVMDKDSHSKKATSDTQWQILDYMAEQLMQNRKGDNIIYDRCPLDNIVYSLWCYEKDDTGIDKEFIDKCVPLVRESMKFIDIIFFTPITKVAKVNIEDNGERESDEEYITETDNLFKAMYQQWLAPKSTFFPENDKPAIIEIFGSRIERLQMCKLYIDTDTGDSIDEQGLLNMNEIEKIESEFRNTGGDTDVNDVKRFFL